MTKCLIKSKLFYFLIQKLNLHVHQLFLLDMFLLFPGFHVFGDSTDIFSIIISDTSFNSSISSVDNSDLGVIYPVITETPLSLFKSILTNFSPHASAKVLIKYPFPDPEGPFIIHIIFALTAKRRKIAASL